jgi:uncharacterized membrane protein YcjF (UPF0283 family)
MPTTENWDDDVRIGVPLLPRPQVNHGGLTPPARPKAPTPDDRIELREGETELGRPPQVPAGLALLSEADRVRLREMSEEQAAKELAEAELLLASDPTGLGWLGWFGTPLVLAFLVGGAGLAGLFVSNQVLSVINALAAQPEWAQWCGYAGLGVFGFCVLYSFLRLAYLYATLRRNRQIQAKGLQELAKRTRLRWLAFAKSAEAKQQLELYLKTFPLDTEKDRNAMLKMGVADEAQARLRSVRNELLDPAKFASTDQWFARFRESFQGELDAAAEARVKYWSSRIWVVTAVSPNALVDSGSALFYTFSMLGDLCQIYNLRVGRTGTAVLLGRIFFNAYLAGQGAEWEKVVEDQYDQLFHEAMSVVGVGVGSNVAGKILGKVGARATTGYLNRVLLLRLGRYAMRLLQPVAK